MTNMTNAVMLNDFFMSEVMFFVVTKMTIILFLFASLQLLQIMI